MDRLRRRSADFFDWIATPAHGDAVSDFVHENARVSDPLLLVSMGREAMSAVYASWHSAFSFGKREIAVSQLSDTTSLIQWHIASELTTPLQGVEVNQTQVTVNGCTRLEFQGNKVVDFSVEVDLQSIFGNVSAPFYFDPAKVYQTLISLSSSLAKRLALTVRQVLLLCLHAMGRSEEFIGALICESPAKVRCEIEQVMNQHGLFSRRLLHHYLHEMQLLPVFRELFDLLLRHLRVAAHDLSIFRSN